MAKITTFMYCEDTLQVDENGKKSMHLVNPLQVITPPFIPSTFSFSITFGIMEFEPNEEHVLNIRFVYEDGQGGDIEIINTGEGPLPKEAIDTGIEKKLQGFIANMELKNVSLREEGIYSTIIRFDGNEIGRFPIRVKGGE